MKKTVINLIAGIFLCVSLFVLLMQGFSLPPISSVPNLILRVVAAAAAQVLSYVNFKYPWLRSIPLVFTIAFALWGNWLFLTSDSWANATFWDYFADYCSLPISCAFVYVFCLIVQRMNRA